MKWKCVIRKDLIAIFSPDNEHLIREYPNRLAIWRKDGNRLTWEELQKVKNIVWGDDVIAIEVYPRQVDCINIKHTRHLWTSKEIQETVRINCQHPEFNN